MEFEDYFSINGWICQYYLIEGEVIESINLAPHVRPDENGKYLVSDRYKHWSIEELVKWFTKMDKCTFELTVLPQKDRKGNDIPSLNCKSFPACDGRWYLAYPVDRPMFYAPIYEFEPHPYYKRWTTDDKIQAYWLDHGQDDIAKAGLKIWRWLQKEEALNAAVIEAMD